MAGLPPYVRIIFIVYLYVCVYMFYFLNVFVFLAVSGLSCGTWDFSLRHVGSSLRCSACAGFSLGMACGLSCPAACGILVPQPGVEPVSPALRDGFLTTGPPGKPLYVFYICFYIYMCVCVCICVCIINIYLSITSLFIDPLTIGLFSYFDYCE